MMYGYGYGMGVWMIIGWIVTIAVIVFAIYGLVILLRRTDEGRKISPLDILKERLAKGEIDSDEFRRIKEELTK